MQNKYIASALKQQHIDAVAKPLWDQITPLLAPLPTPATDIRYHDLFLQLKAELDKPSDIDVTMIEAGARELCMTVAKDIRVMVYLTYAWLRQDAYQGLIRGLLLLYACCVVFADTYQPQSVAQIKNMLRWLGGDKVENAVLLFQAHLLPDEYRAIVALVHLLQQQLMTQHQVDFDELGGLLALLPTEDMPKEQADNASTAAVKSFSSTSPSSGEQPVLPTDLRSSQDLLDTMRRVSQFISEREMNQWASSRLLRVFRWDLLRQLPPHEAGVTRVMPPREVLLKQLDELYVQKNWARLWQSCQYAFMEAANHFWLDLQYLSWSAMQHLGDEALVWADTLSSDVALLLLRLPDLETLAFADGRAFAGDQTQQWLEVHARFEQQDVQHPVVSASPPGLATDDVEAQAFTILREQSMPKALAWLHNVSFADDGLAQARKQYLMAQLAMEAGQWDFAQALLEKINAMLSLEPLFSWDKQWTFQVKKTLWQVLTHKCKTVKAKSADDLLRLDVLVKELTVLDPCLAHQLLYK